MRTPHSSCRKGKKVKVTMRDGTIVIGKFYDKKSGIIILDGVIDMIAIPTGSKLIWELDYVNQTSKIKLHMSEVRAFSIYKPTTKQ